MNKKLHFILAAVLVLSSGCSGGKTDDQGDAVPRPDVGPSGGSPQGTNSFIDLDIVQDLLSVSDTTGFRVFLKDPKGRPLKNQRIYCDSEQGIGVIEPYARHVEGDGSRANEASSLTDDNGMVSGKFGCEEIGSHRVMCRAKVGTDVTAYRTIRCGAPIPVGFTGFAGAAGGGLGGGSVLNPPAPDDGDGGNTGNVRVTAINFEEAGASNTTAVDTQQIICQGADVADPADNYSEPYSDTQVKFAVVNNSTKKVQLKGYKYTILGASNVKSSGFIAFVGEQDVEANGGSGNFSALMFTGGGKNVPLSSPSDSGSTNLAAAGLNGVYNIQFEVFYSDDDTSERSFTAVQSVAIGPYYRCRE